MIHVFWVTFLVISFAKFGDLHGKRRSGNVGDIGEFLIDTHQQFDLVLSQCVKFGYLFFYDSSSSQLLDSMLLLQFYLKQLQLFTLFLAFLKFSFSKFHFQFVHGSCPLFFLQALSQLQLRVCQQLATVLIIKLDQFIECFLRFNEHLFHADNCVRRLFLSRCGFASSIILSIFCLRLLILFNSIDYVISHSIFFLLSLL